MMGLAGAHRTGKTSLAREASRAIDLPFVETSTSAVFQKMGVDPGLPMDFQTRLAVQFVTLKDAMEKWQGYTAGFLSDRTPIDMLAYTLADVQGDTLGLSDELALARYAGMCLEACNKHFAMILLIQPGIPVVPAPGKAALSKGYMEHLNALMSGLLTRKDLKTQTGILRRDILDMEERVECVANTYKRMIKKELQQRTEAVALH